MYKFRSQ